MTSSTTDFSPSPAVSTLVHNTVDNTSNESFQFGGASAATQARLSSAERSDQGRVDVSVTAQDHCPEAVTTVMTNINMINARGRMTLERSALARKALGWTRLQSQQLSLIDKVLVAAVLHGFTQRDAFIRRRYTTLHMKRILLLLDEPSPPYALCLPGWRC